MSKILTTLEFIEKANIKHRARYSYSKTSYKSAKTRITILCSIHGPFLQIPSNHLNGQGCPKCGIITLGAALRKSTEVFIQQAKTIHKDSYDYSKVNYKNARSKVIIICSLHGQFIQRPNTHLNGSGCPKCGEVHRIKSRTKSLNSFILQATSLHNGLYNYSKVVYMTARKPIIIQCTQHGEFLQRPDDHLHGQGCPICRLSKGEQKIEKLLIDKKCTFKMEYTFKDLQGDASQLRFDFAVFKNNKLSCLVEYDGRQHFKYIKGFHKSREAFQLQKKYDKLKNEYCLKNNIILIRIRYDEDICVKLEKELGKI